MHKTKAVVLLRDNSSEFPPNSKETSEQMERITNYANKNGTELVARWTSYSSSCDELEKILDFCRQRPDISYLFVTEPSRISRDVTTYFKWASEFNELDVFIVAVDSMPDPAEGLLEELLEGFAEADSQMRSDMTRKRLSAKREAGYYPNHPPFGYKLSGKPGLHVPDEPVCYVLQNVLKSVANKETTVQVAVQHLKILRHGRGEWTKNTSTNKAIKLLTNPYYAGIIVSEGRTYKGLHTPLITEKEYMEIFRAVRDSGFGENLRCLVCSGLGDEEVD